MKSPSIGSTTVTKPNKPPPKKLQKRRNKTKTPKQSLPNPFPTPHTLPHPSSVAALSAYIDDQILHLRDHYSDGELAYSFLGHEFDILSLSPTTHPPSPQNVATIPNPPRSSQSDPHIDTPGGPFFSCCPRPLAPSRREAIEAHIPNALLQLPLPLRLRGLRAWHEHVSQQLRMPETTRDTPLKLGVRHPKDSKPTKSPRGKELVWWKGTFPATAEHVVRIGGFGDGTGGEGVYGRMQMRESGGMLFEEVSRECLDMDDGHVLGRDWACGRRGPVMLLYEHEAEREHKQRGAEVEKGRKGSVLGKVALVFKRAFLG